MTGEQAVMTLPLKMVTRSSPTLALAASDDALFVIEDRVPDDPARLFEWIDATTNGHLDATNALPWRGSPR
jgi:hypothetical protein